MTWNLNDKFIGDYFKNNENEDEEKKLKFLEQCMEALSDALRKLFSFQAIDKDKTEKFKNAADFLGEIQDYKQPTKILMSKFPEMKINTY